MDTVVSRRHPRYVEIHHLRYFVAVAEELSFSRAAERLHMATSPLSRRIKDLERELGAALFVRGYHQVSLTEIGRRILPLAAELVDKFDTLRSTVLDAGHPEVRSATVGDRAELSRCSSTAAAAAPFLTTAPDARVVLTCWPKTSA